jgi:hypothetical protein
VQVKLTPDEKAMRRFHDTVRQLQKLSGEDFKTVIRSETAAVITAAIRGTKKAAVAKIKADHQAREFVRYNIPYAGKTQRKATATNAYDLRHDYPEWLWSEIKARRERSLKRKLRARGLAASAWVAIADRLGLEVKAPAYVRAAVGRGGRPAADFVHTNEAGEGKQYSLGFLNQLSKLNSVLGLGYVFRRALNARANYFSRSIKLAADKKIRSALDRYPGTGRLS